MSPLGRCLVLSVFFFSLALDTRQVWVDLIFFFGGYLQYYLATLLLGFYGWVRSYM